MFPDNNSGVDEQQIQSEPRTGHQCPTTEIFHPGIASPCAECIMMPPHPEVGHVMAQAAYTYPGPYYRSIFSHYGPQSMIHPHLVGIRQPVPLPSDTVEEPVYVNAKQYHGILRRRQSRAKAESENKLLKCRKPYLHESRHLHALRRARGCGGRFLNGKTNENERSEAASQDKAQLDQIVTD
ncbi:CCAAT-binding transcription factor [Macleaya cordata]|uniref:Nuclear transcription factor Y subunit n=1 Tax=Macleaya cordata TaxID=56857 RepID=A0A200QRJ3_MACCD|nr:CCAAT-binding transcription factor [Macleaya cordata]